MYTSVHSHVSLEWDNIHDIHSDERYNAKSINTSDMILLKVSIDTSNPILQYQYFHVIWSEPFLKYYYIPSACDIM